MPFKLNPLTGQFDYYEASTGGGISDGDKGDITVSGSGSVWEIDAGVVGVTELSATGTPSSSTYLRGDNTWATVSGGSLTVTETEVDFGTTPTTDKLFTITDAGASATSKIIIQASGKPATGRAAGDDQWDTITYAANPGTGSFDVYAKASGSVVGKRKIQYTIS